jgi:hypothetical protein
MNDTYFIVTYRDPENLKELESITVKVKDIRDSSLGLGFISMSGFIFESKSLIVSPNDEKIRAKFEHIKSLHLSIHHIISIEEVGMEHDGLRFKKDKSNLLMLNPEQ